MDFEYIEEEMESRIKEAFYDSYNFLKKEGQEIDKLEFRNEFVNNMQWSMEWIMKTMIVPFVMKKFEDADNYAYKIHQESFEKEDCE